MWLGRHRKIATNVRKFEEKLRHILRRTSGVPSRNIRRLLEGIFPSTHLCKVPWGRKKTAHARKKNNLSLDPAATIYFVYRPQAGDGHRPQSTTSCGKLLAPEPLNRHGQIVPRRPNEDRSRKKLGRRCHAYGAAKLVPQQSAHRLEKTKKGHAAARLVPVGCTKKKWTSHMGRRRTPCSLGKN